MAGLSQKRRIAVVGSGIAGLSTAYHLATSDESLEVELFEKESRLGGHEMPFESPFGTIDLGYMVKHACQTRS